MYNFFLMPLGIDIANIYYTMFIYVSASGEYLS